ncbi:MAG: response regulator [Planctomycetales bacterium]|nr:response regulator [Planctomycetales bacterium]MCA9164502.1 response regulator [Planctomycetales bacterium]
MKILIVDDSKAMRMIVARTLKQAGFSGHTVIEASNGREALEKIASESPEVVLSDWNMPEMKGIELLQKVKEAGHKVRFGFITSESSAETRKLALDSGAVFLLTKPFSAEGMQAILEPVLC